jgi:hypothetical protein
MKYRIFWSFLILAQLTAPKAGAFGPDTDGQLITFQVRGPDGGTSSKTAFVNVGGSKGDRAAYECLKNMAQGYTKTVDGKEVEVPPSITVSKASLESIQEMRIIRPAPKFFFWRNEAVGKVSGRVLYFRVLENFDCDKDRYVIEQGLASLNVRQDKREKQAREDQSPELRAANDRMAQLEEKLARIERGEAGVSDAKHKDHHESGTRKSTKEEAPAADETTSASLFAEADDKMQEITAMQDLALSNPEVAAEQKQLLIERDELNRMGFEKQYQEALAKKQETYDAYKSIDARAKPAEKTAAQKAWVDSLGQVKAVVADLNANHFIINGTSVKKKPRTAAEIAEAKPEAVVPHKDSATGSSRKSSSLSAYVAEIDRKPVDKVMFTTDDFSRSGDESDISKNWSEAVNADIAKKYMKVVAPKYDDPGKAARLAKKASEDGRADSSTLEDRVKNAYTNLNDSYELYTKAKSDMEAASDNEDASSHHLSPRWRAMPDFEDAALNYYRAKVDFIKSKYDHAIVESPDGASDERTAYNDALNELNRNVNKVNEQRKKRLQYEAYFENHNYVQRKVRWLRFKRPDVVDAYERGGKSVIYKLPFDGEPTEVPESMEDYK